MQWPAIRFLFLLAAAVGSVFLPVDSMPLAQADGIVLVVLVLAGLFSLAFAFASVYIAVALQAAITPSEKVWQKPSSSVNPANPGQPLAALHFAGQLAIACGVGHVIAGVYTHWSAVIIGVWSCAIGLMLLLGVYTSAKSLTNKINK